MVDAKGAGLTQRELEKFLFTIESAVRVTNRAQFYLWAQGGLQGMIPHEILICTIGDIGASCERIEICSRLVAQDESLSDILRADGGMLDCLASCWHDKQKAPVHVRAEDNSLVAERLGALGYQSALCHGCVEPAGRNEVSRGSFFVLLHAGRAPSERSCYLIELLMPYLHTAWLRVCEEDRSFIAKSAAVSWALSPREYQVLNLVREGKTNHEIGEVLSISPLTVKNHVQKILRKLGVSNRAQAVAHSVRNDRREMSLS